MVQRLTNIVDTAEELSRQGLAIYLGRNRSEPEFAHRTESVTVLGAPRTGKTSAIISPSVAVHHGPVIATSVRTSSPDHPDVRDTTLSARGSIANRWGGRVMELVIDGKLQTRAERVWWDITHGCDDWDIALERGHALAQGSIPAADKDAKFWRNYVGDLVAAAFFAGAWSDPPLPDRQVAEALVNRDYEVFTTPLARYAHRSGDILRAFEQDHPETKSGAEMILRSQLFGQFKFDQPPFDAYLDLPEFLRSHGTLYITLRLERTEFAAPLLATLVRSVMSLWSTIPRRERAPSLLLALDEVANVAPVGDLPKIISAGGGDGVQCLLGLQSLAQARERWGVEFPVIVTGTSHQVILPGFKDTAFLNDVVALLPKSMQYDRRIRVDGVDPGGRHATHDRLIIERQAIQNARDSARPRLAARYEQAAARRLHIQRLRDGVSPRPGFGDGSRGLQNEVLATTRFEEVAERRPPIEASDLFGARKGKVFVISGSNARFLDAPGWYQDPTWRDVMEPSGTPAPPAGRRPLA